ncbi:glucosamine 6-phosphate N-acetyltransferase-like [Amphibalanus amphitrite]|uniref:glucosamine 6-phosphate N-acetyltransferase-like n=1 Tax=Amphibalanus amphitrite TaxID=1232801 RepID=UPI001C8FF2EF|nr:glucosamine 6-phosphate N-acetyltransferase-like [Amphibalanus amphitrite]
MDQESKPAQNGCVNGAGEGSDIFPRSLLKQLDWADYADKFNPAITAEQPGDGLLVRPLQKEDYDKGFLQLLGQLTEVGDISREDFLKRYEAMTACPSTYYPVVVEDEVKGQVVGAATLVIEQKFIHHCAVRGRLEDVVVSDDYRGKQLGKLLIAVITLLAKRLHCYKITLDCKDVMIPFYSKMGYTNEAGRANYMTIRYD